MRYFGYVLVIIHIILMLWSAGGFVEMSSIKVAWTPYTNMDFPNWLLPIHWGSVLITSIGFLLGYFTKWRGTPQLMLAAYTMLFTICVVETFGFMTSATKYMAMTAEFVTYAVILIMLFRNKYFVSYFK